MRRDVQRLRRRGAKRKEGGQRLPGLPGLAQRSLRRAPLLCPTLPPAHSISDRLAPWPADFGAHQGCVWDSSELLPGAYTGVEALTQLWLFRTRFFLRLVHVGINVLHLDNDVFVFDDPYKYLKAPPYKDVNWIAQPENSCRWWC